MTRRGQILALSLLAAAASCADEEPLPPDPGLPMSVTGVDPELLLPGSRFSVRGTNFLDGRDETKLVLEGTMTPSTGAAYAVFVELKGTVAGPTQITVKMTATILGDSALGFGGFGDFAGTIKVVQRKGTELREASASASLQLRSTVAPELDEPGILVLFFGDVHTLRGQGLLFADEGATTLRAEGRFEKDSGGTDLIDTELATTGVSRNELTYTHGLDAFGTKPGKFVGTLTPVNTLDSGVVEGDAVDVEIYSVVPLIAAVVPAGPNNTTASGASRGQKVYFDGGGFLEDDARQESTLVEIRGDFADSGGDTTAVSTVLATRLVRPGRLAWTLQTEEPGRGPFPGPGTFTGSATPIVLRGRTEVRGTATPFTLEVKPTKQVVYLKYLAGFDDALRSPPDGVFGLYNAQARIKAGILAKVRKDYCWPTACGYSINVDFRTARPDDFAEYMVVELSGVDPNGADLLGYDNSAGGGKDLGNLHLDDVIGGAGAQAEEGGVFKFGGVFQKSFMRMSPTYNAKYALQGGSESARFDDVFKPFSREINASAVEISASEGNTTCPQASGRPKQICEAIRVLSNLVGNTLTHEIGHSLGLASEAGAHPDDQYHNPGDGNWIMDPGTARPFTERAELDGAAAAVWHPEDLTYLQSILPGE